MILCKGSTKVELILPDTTHLTNTCVQHHGFCCCRVQKEEMQHMTVLNVAEWEKHTRCAGKQLWAGSERAQQLRDGNKVNVQNDCVYKFRRRTSCMAATLSLWLRLALLTPPAPRQQVTVMHAFFNLDTWICLNTNNNANTLHPLLRPDAVCILSCLLIPLTLYFTSPHVASTVGDSAHNQHSRRVQSVCHHFTDYWAF